MRGRSRPGRDIVFIGSVREEKGAALLIQAFERLNGRVKGDLVFVGRPLLRGAVARRAQRHPRIRFLGELPSAGVQRALARAKLVVLPSRNEGLPMSILEAMACERPVLVTATGQLPRLIREGRSGFLLTQRSPAALAERIQMIDTRRDLARIGRAAREAVRPFTIHAVVERYVTLYRLLLG